MSRGGLCDYELDGENCLMYFFLATVDRVNLSTAFLDVVSFDRTNKSNEENLYLFQVVALDTKLMAMPLCIAFISRETSTSLSKILSFIQSSTSSQSRVGRYGYR